jgi:thymidylate synthase
MLKRLSVQNKTHDGEMHEEYQYIHLIGDIVQHGELIEGRNGKAKTVFGSAMHFTLENNVIPLLTSKRVAWKTCLKELLWFVSGSTSNDVLREQNVKIWNENASRDFLDSRGLQHLRENDLGPVYGHQWRHFNAPYTTCDASYEEAGVDQLSDIIEVLKDPKTRSSRRMVISAWNPCQIDQMALPPCHVLIQFNVLEGDKLSCSLYQRSGDVGLGVPFNIASYCFLTHLIAHHCGLRPGEFIYYLGNAHIYDDHLVALQDQMSRPLHPFPTIEIGTRRCKIDEYVPADFTISDYVSESAIKMVMRK